MRDLKPFESDGCSIIGPIVRFFGYRNVAIEKCCYIHDYSYWKGGPWSEKRKADRAFRECLATKVSPWIAWLMWAGVAIGGFIPHPRWGWGFGRLRP